MKSFDKGMTGQESQMFLQTTMQKRQEKNMPPVPTAPEAPAQPADSVK